MNTLVFLSYGEGPHVDELTYAVLSATELIAHERGEYRIVIYTDTPSRFKRLHAHVEPVAERRLAEWAGPFGFGHRRKICAIKDALVNFGPRVLFCDTDTFFTDHPRKAFARISPGRTVMHIGEYRLGDRCAAYLRDFTDTHTIRNLAGEPWQLTAKTEMFNSGVVGVHAADVALLDEAAYLTDQIYPCLRRQTIEQLSLSVCLSHRTRLRQAYDLVHHYWIPERRAAFHRQLDPVLRDDSLSDAERLARVAPHRPSLVKKDRPFKSAVDRGVGRRSYEIAWTLANRAGVITYLRRRA